MLFGKPTPKGTGVEIYGDAMDLQALYDLVTSIADTQRETFPTLYDFFYEFAYEVMKCQDGERIFYTDHDTKYKGFRYNWIEFILIVKYTRIFSSYANKFKQFVVYNLEYLLETSLKEYDLQGAALILDYFENYFPAQNKFIPQVSQFIRNIFLQEKTGKIRFRKISELFELYFHPISDGYNKVVASIKAAAFIKEIEIHKLSLKMPPGEIKW